MFVKARGTKVPCGPEKLYLKAENFSLVVENSFKSSFFVKFETVASFSADFVCAENSSNLIFEIFAEKSFEPL